MINFSGNKGEWSEPYALLKLLADKKLTLGDKDLNKIHGLILSILSILRHEKGYDSKYSYSNENVIIKLGEKELYYVPVIEFKNNAKILLQYITGNKINKAENKGLSIPEVKNLGLY